MYIICHEVAYNLYNLSDMGSIVFVAVFNGYDGVEATSHCCKMLSVPPSQNAMASTRCACAASLKLAKAYGLMC